MTKIIITTEWGDDGIDDNDDHNNKDNNAAAGAGDDDYDDSDDNDGVGVNGRARFSRALVALWIAKPLSDLQMKFLSRVQASSLTPWPAEGFRADSLEAFVAQWIRIHPKICNDCIRAPPSVP
ncbi:hypothetical protein PoB_005290000 [Plakobranchus ocellatus]|uniref:Uncharacterized protein n=1 Tax=Plakobranchus ocellatus TaxID=259542 RepID=A0AAV4C157_9GAST|nr:hypothetical protein PoB_005290000 [Plakobranchus ocellatus]